MTNPNNAVGTNAAYNGRTSVDAFNDVMGAFSGRGVLSGWNCAPGTGMTVQLGGDGSTRDAAIAEDNAGNRTSVNNISGSPVEVAIAAAPATGNRIDLIVAYVDNPPTGVSTEADNLQACGIIDVTGTAATNPTAPNETAIRNAITADGATGASAYYVVLAQVRVGTNVTSIGSGVITQGTKATLGDGTVTSDSIDFATFGSHGLPTPDGSNTTSGVGTVYYKKLLPKVYLLWGTITPKTSSSSVALPHPNVFPSGGQPQTFICWGSGLDFTKAFISPGASVIGFTQNTTSTSYALWAIACLDDA